MVATQGSTLPLGVNVRPVQPRDSDMELISKDAFLRWAAGRGIVPDPRFREYPSQAPLAFAGVPSLWRRWSTPEAVFNLPNLASCLVGCAAAQGALFLFLKGGASWFTGSSPETGPEWEHLRDRVVGTLPIPRDFSGALRFASSEHDDVVLLMVTFLVYAWCVADDLQIVPEDGRVIIETSHHGDVVVNFPDEERMKSFVTDMSEREFPACVKEDGV